MSKPELVAIYRLEFYKKQKNWKFGRETKKKSARPKKRIPLDQTYDVVSPHNEAFLETGPNAPHASDNNLEVAVFDITHKSEHSEPIGSPPTTEPQKSPDINSNYINKNDETIKTKSKISNRLQAFFEAVKNCSDYIEESNETDVCYRNNDWPECDNVFYTNLANGAEDVDSWNGRCGDWADAREGSAETDVIWPPSSAPEADLLAHAGPDEKQLLLQDLWIQLREAAGTGKTDGVQHEYPHQRPTDPQAYPQRLDNDPKDPRELRNYSTHLQQFGEKPTNTQLLGNNPTNPYQAGYKSTNTYQAGYDPPYPNNPKDPQQLGKNTAYPQRLGYYPTNPQQLGNYPTNPQQLGNNPTNPQQLGNNPTNPQQLGNYPTNPQQLGNYPTNPQQKGNYPTNPQQLGNYPTNPQQLGNHQANLQQLGNHQANLQQAGYNPPYPNNPQQLGYNTTHLRKLENNLTIPQELGIYPTISQQYNAIELQHDIVGDYKSPYPKEPQSRPDRLTPQPDENFLKNLLQNRVDLSLNFGTMSEFAGPCEKGAKSENALTSETWVEDVCGAVGSDSWGSLDSAEFMLGAQAAPHSSEVELPCSARDSPPPPPLPPSLARSPDFASGRGRGRLSVREREQQRAVLWERRGRM